MVTMTMTGKQKRKPLHQHAFEVAVTGGGIVVGIYALLRVWCLSSDTACALLDEPVNDWRVAVLGVVTIGAVALLLHMALTVLVPWFYRGVGELEEEN